MTVFKTSSPSLKTELNFSEKYNPKHAIAITAICDDMGFFPLLWSYSIVFTLFLKRIQRTLTLSSLYTGSEEGDKV